ncbi:MAG: three-Cys-motif partner protein TcmP, partial [Planctomycetes bacterium]|nr:three-Cys-motif partner protein TcmP [Planctomycetota bacterium]
MGKDINRESYDEATLTKLEIFERYLEMWLPVFIQTPFAKSIAIWDFFAGSGQDSEGVPGSPLRIIRQIISFKDQILKNNKSISVVLNENATGKFTELAELVENRRNEWNHAGLVKVECRNEDFRTLFRDRHDDLKHQPNLIFIDQYGIKHVSGEVFKTLIGLPKTDFLFFISSSYMKRFAGTPEFKAIFPKSVL